MSNLDYVVSELLKGGLEISVSIEDNYQFDSDEKKVKVKATLTYFGQIISDSEDYTYVQIS